MVESFLESRPFEPPIAEAVASDREARGDRIPRVPEEILPSGIVFRDSLTCMRGALLFSLGVGWDDTPERDGIAIRCEVAPAFDLPAELGGADLGADCLRSVLAAETEPAITIIAAVASSAIVNLNLNSFMINPRMNAVSGKIRP
ncbi:MAG: hypothetical protein ABIF19_17400 [Planctomycetota bacterium]